MALSSSVSFPASSSSEEMTSTALFVRTVASVAKKVSEIAFTKSPSHSSAMSLSFFYPNFWSCLYPTSPFLPVVYT
jgi:hypothetical protein